MLRVDRRWHAMNRVVRDSSTPFSSDWVTSASPTPPFSSYSINASADSTAGRSAAEAAMLGRHPTPERKGKVRTRFAPGSNDAEKAISPSLVQVHFSMPYMIDGTAGAEFKGTGLVVDTEKGLVVVDRNTVPCSLGDVNISFGSSLHVPGRVCFIHPLHNIAVLSYDPKSVGDTPVKAALLCTDEDMTHEKKGTKVTLVGLSGGLRGGTQLSSHEAKVADSIRNITGFSHPPRFQDCNLDTLNLNGVSPTSQQDGAVVDEKGQVLAFWGSFSMQVNNGGRLQDVQVFQGIPGDILSEVVEPLKANKIPSLKTLGAEYEYVGLNQVRLLGLDDAAVVDLEASTIRWPPTLLAVRRRWEGSPASKLLEDGDVVLSIDGKPVRTYRAVELAVRSKEGVELEVLRGGRKQKVQIPTMNLGTDETRELLLWA
eukprot:CAMPEP_0119501412 /NCGR_PEP_ID=MMETSP1344-20130328/23250_1 /TAXON_ID=236787 /ORGANISM="Florenciella parvula, Strain CCMP2471" /LENGTH=426 /DNA_ID=CAMNT_0007537569 /DNA_START=1 /DNA_END=1277 /DNA_ORIENTATION=+